MSTLEDESVVIIRRQPLDAQGDCTKCTKKADHEAIQCFGCDEMYHVINCPPGNTRGQVTRTFFGGWENMIQNYSNINYICDACLQDKKFKKDIIVSNRMCLMEEEMRSIKETLDQKFYGLQDTIKGLVNGNFANVSTTLPGESFADKVKSDRSVIVIKKKKNGPPADMDTIRQAAVNTNSAISKAYKNNSGDTIIVCEDQASKDSMVPALTEAIDKDKFTVVTPASRQPTITVINIAGNYDKADLLESVKIHNVNRFQGIDVNETNFKVLYTKQQYKNKELYKATVRVSDAIRDAIKKSGDRLNIGLTSCAVFDNFFVKRCNRCQRYNHWKDKCSEDTPVVCGKCSGNHDTTSCDSDTLKCYNCVQAKYEDTNHETFSNTCKAYIDAQKRLESTINYYKNCTKN